MEKITPEELVAILACFSHRKIDIEKMKNDPYVSDDYRDMIEKDLVLIQSVTPKLLSMYSKT